MKMAPGANAPEATIQTLTREGRDPLEPNRELGHRHAALIVEGGTDSREVACFVLDVLIQYLEGRVRVEVVAEPDVVVPLAVLVTDARFPVDRLGAEIDAIGTGQPELEARLVVVDLAGAVADDLVDIPLAHEGQPAA